MINKIDGSTISPGKYLIIKIGKWSFGNIEYKHSLYHGVDYIKKSISLKEHAAYLINFEKKYMLPVKAKELQLHQDSMICYVSWKRFTQRLAKYENVCKVTDHCHFTSKYKGIAHIFSDLWFNMPSKILVVSHNGSNFDYLFIIKELANKFNRGFVCLGKIQNNKEKILF